MDAKQYAIVDGDVIVSLGNFERGLPDAADLKGRRLLPVVFEDSAPFDPNLHYRLAPISTIEGETVVRRYPVILKGEDI